jgi:nicotinamide mononucleotide transporter
VVTLPSTLEIVAAGFGILSVFLGTRQIIWSWPTALVNVSLYAWYFFDQRLYALMALQGFFASVSIYGWYEWLRGGAGHTALRVSHTPRPLAVGLAAFAASGSVLLVFLLDRYTEDPSPGIDGTLAIVSLGAQWMMARKYLENWLVWIGVNCVSVPFFFLRADYATTVQYAVFLGLAISGYRQWKRSLQEGHRAAAPVAGTR